MWNHNNYSRKFWDNSKCKCDQGKAILDGIEFRVSKIIYKDICIKVHGYWGWSLVCASVSLSILKCPIVANEFSCNLKTHKTCPMIAPWGVSKLGTSPKVTVFPPPVPYYIRPVLERWPLSHFVLENFDSSNGFVKSSNPQNLKYFERRNLIKYKPSSQHTFAFTYIDSNILNFC